MEQAVTRILVDAHVFDGKHQGTRTFIREIYNALAQKKDVVIYMAAHDIENLKDAFKGKDNMVFLKFKHTSSIKRLLFDIPRLIKEHRIDYAHFQYIVPLVRNCKFIVTVHDVIFNEYPDEFSWWYRVSKNFLFKVSALRSDIVTTVSQYSKKSIGKYLRVPEKNITVTPNGVNLRFFDNYDKKSAEDYIFSKFGFNKYILYVSRIEPRKNHVALIKSYLELKLYQYGYHLALLGYKSIRVKEFDTILENMPADIRQFIFVSSEVDDEDLLSFYRAASFFVYPSKAEGFGIPPLEAGALKIPVICSNSSAMSDFTFFGEYHFDPYNYEELNKKMLKMVSNPPDDHYLTNVAMAIRRQYSWNESAETLYRLLVNTSQTVSRR
jgi:glycosyltransferase involved in cell wall biosynthesis